MKNMYTVEEASKLIKLGRKLLIAGEESLLAQLPSGNWIAGTIPYFMSEDGGIVEQKRIFGHDITEIAKSFNIKSYKVNQLTSVYSDLPSNGFGVIIIPAMSEAHASFATNAPNYPNFACSPLLGWIAGIHLNDLGKKAPVVWNGKTGEKINNGAVVMQVGVVESFVPNLDILNLFEQGNGDSIKFPKTGFSANEVIVNGKTMNFSEYLKNHKIDTRWPLVANYAGAMINVSFQGVDEANKIVNFYAPVFENVEYKLAKPILDYSARFEKAIPKDAKNLSFSCNCILNFLYGELEGKRTSINGPMTFGEIAYQLLNQTMVYVTMDKR